MNDDLQIACFFTFLHSKDTERSDNEKKQSNAANPPIEKGMQSRVNQIRLKLAITFIVSYLIF